MSPQAKEAARLVLFGIAATWMALSNPYAKYVQADEHEQADSQDSQDVPLAA